MTPALLAVNSARISGGRATPEVFSGSGSAVVTTDVFAFDDSTDYYGLQGLGQVCDMGDAMVANALQSISGMPFYSIRNASDPQIPNLNHNIQEASKQAAVIYAKYGGLTTAASLVATWAVIQASDQTSQPNESSKISAGFRLGRRAPGRLGR